MLPVATIESNLSLELIPPGSEIRIRVLGTASKPLWVAADVCRVLGIQNGSNALADYSDDEKGVERLCTPGGPQTVLVVSEIGLYRLIFRSDKPAAREFQKWVFSEVLPSIRQFGCYPAPENPVDPMIAVFRGMADQLEAQHRLRLEHQALAHRVESVESKLADLDSDTGYRTLVGFARDCGMILPLKDAQRHGKALARIHKERGVKIGQVADERFGSVCSYRADILREYFAALAAG